MSVFDGALPFFFSIVGGNVWWCVHSGSCVGDVMMCTYTCFCVWCDCVYECCGEVCVCLLDCMLWPSCVCVCVCECIPSCVNDVRVHWGFPSAVHRVTCACVPLYPQSRDFRISLEEDDKGHVVAFSCDQDLHNLLESHPALRTVSKVFCSWTCLNACWRVFVMRGV